MKQNAFAVGTVLDPDVTVVVGNDAGAHREPDAASRTVAGVHAGEHPEDVFAMATFDSDAVVLDPDRPSIAVVAGVDIRISVGTSGRRNLIVLLTRFRSSWYSCV